MRSDITVYSKENATRPPNTTHRSTILSLHGPYPLSSNLLKLFNLARSTDDRITITMTFLSLVHCVIFRGSGPFDRFLTSGIRAHAPPSRTVLLHPPRNATASTLRLVHHVTLTRICMDPEGVRVAQS